MPFSAFFTRRGAVLLLTVFSLLSLAPASRAQELKPIQLPKPQITAGMPLMEALERRQTTRAFMDKPLPMQTLSNLLWAAFGVNRPRSAKPGLGRTAPSANNKQEVELYVALAQGVYIYDAEANLLRPSLAGDLRAGLCQGSSVHAPVTIIFVADSKEDSAQVDTGFIGQNIYLFAASEGLNAWFYAFWGKHDAGTIGATLKLPASKRALYAQSVCYPPQ